MTGLRWSWPTPRRLGTVDEPPSLVVFQDALRTRFVGNWCRVMQTGEHSKPVLQPGSGVYPPVRGLWWNRLPIRRLHVQVVQGVPIVSVRARL